MVLMRCSMRRRSVGPKREGSVLAAPAPPVQPTSQSPAAVRVDRLVDAFVADRRDDPVDPTGELDRDRHRRVLRLQLRLELGSQGPGLRGGRRVTRTDTVPADLRGRCGPDSARNTLHSPFNERRLTASCGPLRTDQTNRFYDLRRDVVEIPLYEVGPDRETEHFTCEPVSNRKSARQGHRLIICRLAVWRNRIMEQCLYPAATELHL